VLNLHVQLDAIIVVVVVVIVIIIIIIINTKSRWPQRTLSKRIDFFACIPIDERQLQVLFCVTVCAVGTFFLCSPVRA